METDVDWSARAMLDAVRYEFTHDRQQGAPASSRKARAKLSDDGPAGTARRSAAASSKLRSPFMFCHRPSLSTLVPEHPESQSVEATPALQAPNRRPRTTALDEKQ